MLCDKCNKNEATLHYTKIVNGKKTEQHLCSECAKGMNDTFTFDDIFKNVFNLNSFGGHPKYSNELRCDGCGLTLNELNRTGRLGCAKCVDTFKDAIEPALKNIHSGTVHKGKRPGKAVSLTPKVDKRASLEAELKEAIKNEEYEKAAEIRDILRNMDKEA